MMYLVITAKRKNARRHIANKGEDINYLRKIGKECINDNYIVEIYSGSAWCWKLVERIK